MSRSDYSSPESYARAQGLDLDGPITAEELLAVFDFRPIHADCVVVDREKAPNKAAGIYVPSSVRQDHQTGSPKGRIIWIGPRAKEGLDNRLKECGYKDEVKVGDTVCFGVMHPQPANLAFNGQSIVIGLDNSRWSGVAFIHWDDVRAHVPANNLQSPTSGDVIAGGQDV